MGAQLSSYRFDGPGRADGLMGTAGLGDAVPLKHVGAHGTDHRRPPTPPTPAAYGGPSWPAREASLADELGSVWSRCGIDSEYATLQAVLLHRPGAELFEVEDADEHLMLETPDAALCGAQHDVMADAYRANGVQVVYVDPGGSGDAGGSGNDAEDSAAPLPPANQMFCADLFVMTPSGAIVGRPASTVRAGEERWIARRLADCGGADPA